MTDHIKEPYTLAEIKAKIASNEYSAELLLQHAMLLLDAQPAPSLTVGERSALVPVETLKAWKSMANSLAVLSLKSERTSTAIALKQLIQAEIDDAKPAKQGESVAWQPIVTAPREFLLGVWEGDWRNPKRNFSIYQASADLRGDISWAMRGRYRTEEGGAYELAGWLPLPAAPGPNPPAQDKEQP